MGIFGNRQFGANGHFGIDELWGKGVLLANEQFGANRYLGYGGIGGLRQIDIWENEHFGPMGVGARGDKWAQKMT